MKQNKLFAEILSALTKCFVVLVIVAIVGICCSGIRVVESGNVALILRFGELVGQTREDQIHQPGLLLAFPYVIDEVIVVPTGSVMEQSITTYYTNDATMMTSQGAYVITGDQNIATLSASVKYVINDPVAYALHVNDIANVINACVSNALLTEAAETDVDDLLTNGKDDFAARSLRRAEEKLTAAQIGIDLTTLELTYVAMPSEVRDIYAAVNAAAVDAATIIENARNYRTTVIPRAQSIAAQTLTQANADYSGAVAAANEALAEFWGVLDEYESNPQVVNMRLYTDKMTGILRSIGTVRVVQDEDTKIFLNP